MRKLLSVLLAAVLLLSVCAVPVSAAATHEEKTRAIAIVFDNSGSMYLPEGSDDARKAWCRATYAMEAFATMMNASDAMYIYPMHPITVGSESYSSSSPLRITQKNAATIREIYTPNPLGTPIETISTARQGLASVSADEKWLIVLTDGTTFSKGGGDLGSNTAAELNTVLTECSRFVNVMYLGIGSQSVIPSGISYFADRAASSTDVLSKLTAMCNMIFGRDTLEVAQNNISFDVSMRKLILFVQGDGIQNVSLSGATPTSTNTLRYSEKGGGGQAAGEFRTDKSLQGVMLTYGATNAGTYTLSYSGNATSIVAYYEPDVDLSVVLRDAAGNPVSANDEPVAGTYTLDYCLLDNQGKVATSPLLGSTQYEITYTINGQSHTVTADKAGQVEIPLNGNDVLDANVKVTYLSGYKLERSGPELGWPSGGITFAQPAGKLDVELEGGSKEYHLTKLPEEDIFRPKFTYEGKACTAEDLDHIQVEAKLEGDGNAACTVGRDEQGYYVKVDYYNGSPLATDPGRYKLVVSGVYTNDSGQRSNTAADSERIKIEDDSSDLEIDLDVPQSYYQLSELQNGKPMTVHLSLDGKPLTPEQMAKTALTYSCDDEIDLILEPLPDQSAYRVTVNPDNPPEDDRYYITFAAAGFNEIGKPVTAEERTSIQVREWPEWLRTLIPFFILLLIALLILWYMTRKVLPKAISAELVTFNVDGEQVPGRVIVNGGGRSKKMRTVTVESPKYANASGVKAGLTFTVKAVSRRYVLPPRRREMLVTDIAPLQARSVQSYKLGSKTFRRDETTGKFVPSGGRAKQFQPFTIKDRSEISVSSEISDGRSTTSVYFKGRIKTR